MNKLLIFFLGIFSFFIFSSVNALQEYMIRSYPGSNNSNQGPYGYNIGVNPFWVSGLTNEGTHYGCASQKGIIIQSPTGIVTCYTGVGNEVADNIFYGTTWKRGTMLDWYFENPSNPRIIVIKGMGSHSGNRYMYTRVIMNNQVLEAPDNDPGIYISPSTNESAIIPARPSIAVNNNSITVLYSTGVRRTYAIPSGAVISTDNAIPLTGLPWSYHAASDNEIQMIVKTSTGYALSINTQISPGVWGVNNSPIFHGALLGGELQKLNLGTYQTGAVWSKFYSYDIDNNRYYVLSQCRHDAVWDTANPGYNNTWIGSRPDMGGTVIGFGLSENNPYYHRYVNQGNWLNHVDNMSSMLSINYGGNCRPGYAFSDFIGNIPGRVYVMRNNALYVNILSPEDRDIISQSGGGGGSGGGGSIGQPEYIDQWAACKAIENDWTEFLGCLGSFFSYLGEQIINFFKAIPAWINKMLEIWTTDTRTISFFPTAYAGGGGIAGLLLPDRDPSYGENTIGQIDGMLTGIVFAMIFIITLVVILYITRK